MIDDIRSLVENKLNELDGIVGLRQTDHGVAPYLFQRDDDITQLVLEPRYPLAQVASQLQKRFREADFGIVARGCDTRALFEMTKRLQIDQDRLFILGFACTAEQAEKCYCTEPVPNTMDWSQSVVLGDPVPSAKPNPVVLEHENLDWEERWDFWQKHFVKCIKCYGCRDICPVCFCEACALEDPMWVEPGLLAPNFPTYHLIKAMHMTTRCIACRQCELACPADIPLTVLYDLIRKDVADLIGYVPGADFDAKPPLSLTLADSPMKSELV
jgi:ferredoxin